MRALTYCCQRWFHKVLYQDLYILFQTTALCSVEQMLRSAMTMFHQLTDSVINFAQLPVYVWARLRGVGGRFSCGFVSFHIEKNSK